MAQDSDRRSLDLSAQEGADHAEALRRTADRFGFHLSLGNGEQALYLRGGSDLLVCFESEAEIRGRSDRLPRGWRHHGADGWSTLTLTAPRGGWFRHEEVYDFFDRMTDEGFFDSFDRVLFFGAGPCGYAAAAFSVAAPGARVLALAPQATLDPRRAGWDPRFRSQRRFCFRNRYGYAPDMVEGAEAAWVIFDPEIAEDAMHASLFDRPSVTLLRAPHLGPRLGPTLEGMEILDLLLRAAMSGELDRHRFARLLRMRRDYVPYLKSLLHHLQDCDRPILADRLCRYAAGLTDEPLFRQELERRDPTHTAAE